MRISGTCHAIGVLLLGALQATAAPLPPTAIVFCPEDATLRGSRWGPVGELQRALAWQLAECGQKGIEVDGCFAPATREGLWRLGTCAGFGECLAVSDAQDGAITAEEREQFVGTPVPDAGARAFVMVLTHEGTDFDRAFFLDLAAQCRVDAHRVEVAREALRALEERLGRSPDPAERRRCMGETWADFVSPAWREDRRARNAAFTIDALPLSESERAAWLHRRTRASAAGLSDDRPAE